MAPLPMKISLIRHGRPLVDYRARIKGSALGAWLDAYEHAAVDHALPPPERCVALAEECSCVVTSPA